MYVYVYGWCGVLGVCSVTVLVSQYYRCMLWYAILEAQKAKDVCDASRTDSEGTKEIRKKEIGLQALGCVFNCCWMDGERGGLLRHSCMSPYTIRLHRSQWLAEH